MTDRIKARPGRHQPQWPADVMPVELERVPSNFERVDLWDVYAAGNRIGRLEAFEYTERVNYAGRRYGYDLKPRRVWRAVRLDHTADIRRNTRWEAVRDLVDYRRGKRSA